jgi:hypothetical protein
MRVLSSFPKQDQTPHVADLALAHQRIKSFKRFLEWSQTIPLMNLIEIDDVGPQPLQARLTFTQQMVTR